MSWQCPFCETVNQDAVPYCTVCDRISPVIEAYLSLEQINNARVYNQKLEQVHQFEAKGEYEQMLSTALEAISIYKENGVAVGKAEVAIRHKVEADMANDLFEMIDKSIDDSDFECALIIVKMIEKMNCEEERVKLYKDKIEESKAKARCLEIEQVKSNRTKRFPKLVRPERKSPDVIVNDKEHTEQKTRKYPKVKRNT